MPKTITLTLELTPTDAQAVLDWVAHGTSPVSMHHQLEDLNEVVGKLIERLDGIEDGITAPKVEADTLPADIFEQVEVEAEAEALTEDQRLARRLKTWRLNHSLTQAQAANLAKTSQPTWSSWENPPESGHSTRSMNILERFLPSIE